MNINKKIDAFLINEQQNFPDSVVKNIVFHGTNKKFKNFNFSNSLQRIIWFTDDKNSILEGSAGASGKGFIAHLLVNIKNPTGWDLYNKLTLDEIQSKGYDGVILKESDETFNGFVFYPNQVKIIKWESI